MCRNISTYPFSYLMVLSTNIFYFPKHVLWFYKCTWEILFHRFTSDILHLYLSCHNLVGQYSSQVIYGLDDLSTQPLDGRYISQFVESILPYECRRSLKSIFQKYPQYSKQKSRLIEILSQSTIDKMLLDLFLNNEQIKKQKCENYQSLANFVLNILGR